MIKIISEEEKYEHHFEENKDFVEHRFSVDLANGEVIFHVDIGDKTKKELSEKGYLI